MWVQSQSVFWDVLKKVSSLLCHRTRNRGWKSLPWVTESQKKWDLWRSLVQPPAKNKINTKLHQISCDFAQTSLENLQGWRFYHFSG